MKVIATNIGKPTTFLWNGKEEQTGIFKYPTQAPLQLGSQKVVNDTIINRVHHGGDNKACYLFSKNHYPYWKNQYPNLKWDWGMFGENLTVEELDESQLRIGTIYQLGKAVIQITQPREPCYKLGVRFKDPHIIRKFVDYACPGTYVKVLQEGVVKTGDLFELKQKANNFLTVKQFYQLLYAKEKDRKLLELFMSNDAVPTYKKEQLRKHL